MSSRVSLATILGFVAALFLWFTMTQIDPTHTGELAIVLIKNNTILVANADILSYNSKSHEFTLTSECVERLKPMGWRLSGNFRIVLHGETVLTGIIVPPIVSRSYNEDQVVLLYPTFTFGSGDMNYRVIKLQMGYPWDLSVNLDIANPLDNPKIVAHFENSSRLIE